MHSIENEEGPRRRRRRRRRRRVWGGAGGFLDNRWGRSPLLPTLSDYRGSPGAAVGRTGTWGNHGSTPHVRPPQEIHVGAGAHAGWGWLCLDGGRCSRHRVRLGRRRRRRRAPVATPTAPMGFRKGGVGGRHLRRSLRGTPTERLSWRRPSARTYGTSRWPSGSRPPNPPWGGWLVLAI